FGGRVSDLLFTRFAFFWQMGHFGLKALQPSVAILQGEQFFEHIEHRAMMSGPLKIIQRALYQLLFAVFSAIKH
ncbi:MAG TPA: hypothetical protein VIT23_08800, partial [Terrimicrobiaceae bacterium]